MDKITQMIKNMSRTERTARTVLRGEDQVGAQSSLWDKVQHWVGFRREPLVEDRQVNLVLQNEADSVNPLAVIGGLVFSGVAFKTRHRWLAALDKQRLLFLVNKYVHTIKPSFNNGRGSFKTLTKLLTALDRRITGHNSNVRLPKQVCVLFLSNVMNAFAIEVFQEYTTEDLKDLTTINLNQLVRALVPQLTSLISNWEYFNVDMTSPSVLLEQGDICQRAQLTKALIHKTKVGNFFTDLIVVPTQHIKLVTERFWGEKLLVEALQNTPVHELTLLKDNDYRFKQLCKELLQVPQLDILKDRYYPELGRNYFTQSWKNTVNTIIYVTARLGVEHSIPQYYVDIAANRTQPDQENPGRNREDNPYKTLFEMMLMGSNRVAPDFVLYPRQQNGNGRPGLPSGPGAVVLEQAPIPQNGPEGQAVGEHVIKETPSLELSFGSEDLSLNWIGNFAEDFAHETLCLQSNSDPLETTSDSGHLLE